MAAAVVASLAATHAAAEVIRFEVLSREARPGGELITARATIALDPGDRHNAAIADLALAPRNPQGRVEATTDVTILRPSHPSGAVVVDLPNRGHAAAAIYLGQDAPEFLANQGITVVEVGWQGDVSSGVVFHAPVLKGLTGRSRETWVMSDAQLVTRLSLAYPAAATPDARVNVRLRPDAAPEIAPGLTVRFVDPMTIELIRPAALARAGSVVELSYTATDPKVMGMGFAAVRDVTAFLKRADSADNPLRDIPHKRMIGFGVSQSGRALRDLLYQGFNLDEADRPVFDGMMPIIPGARRSFTNARFAQPGRNPGPIADHLYPVDQFPFAYETSIDRLSGQRGGLLDACRASSSCPKIIEVDSEFEFWGSHASLNAMDPQGRPLPIAPEVRLFLVAGAQHSPDQAARSTPQCRLATSPVRHAPVSRALVVAMDAWIAEGRSPPASRYPTVPAGTLVPAAAVYDPPIPALGYRAQYAKAPLVARTADGPVVKAWYPLMFPKTDRTGEAIAAVRVPAVAAPRATYVGWNPQAGVEGPEDLCTQLGATVPLPATRAEAVANHDPRPSLAELYPSDAAYVSAVRSAAEALVRDRLLLRADADADIHAAEAGDPARSPR